MNKIILIGNLGQAAVLRDVPKRDGLGSTPVVNFSLAVKQGWGDRERTLWYGCSWWGDRAAKVSAWLTKGRQVMVEGEPEEVRMFERRDKTTGTEITVTVRELELLGGSRADGAAPEGGGQGALVGAKPAAVVDDDVAF